MMRFLNICVIVALVMAAAYVYRIKFESARQAEQVARLRLDIRREHDTVAALRAEWSRLDNPNRVEALAQRHLSLRPIDSRQFDQLDRLPERPPDPLPPDAADPIASLLDPPDPPTGSIVSAGKAE
jgi:cell division protein FtsL